MATFIFPGQGSQSKGMGESLFDEFTELTKQADQILGYSIQKLCIEDPDLNLNLTKYTQPALYVVNALSYLKRIKDKKQKPAFLVGHSLGEYNALFAAGVFDFATGLRLVQKRGELMNCSVEGGMAAVIGLDEEQIAEVIIKNKLETLDIANYNSPYQIVISGPKKGIEEATPIFEADKRVKMVIPLKTSGAFHSRYMEDVKKEFKSFLNSFEFSKITIPVISNVNARPYQQADVKYNLVEQITHPVRWTESIRYLMGRGEEKFEEIGPGRVLTGLLQRIQKEAEPLVIEETEKEAIKTGEHLVQSRVENETKSKKMLFVKEPLENHAKGSIPAIKQPQTTKEENHVPKKDETSSKQSSDATIAKVNNSISEKADKNNPVEDHPNETAVSWKISVTALGSQEFKQDYKLKYAYVIGGMHHGITSKEMVIKAGKSGLMAFFGANGLKLSEIEGAIQSIQKELHQGESFGVNLQYNLTAASGTEEETIDVILKQGVNNIEADGFLNITPALVKYRAKGLTRNKTGYVVTSNKIIAKISRPEVAEAFLSPAPENIISKLREENKITSEEARLLKEIPMADDLCAVADSGGRTDGRAAYTLLPAIMMLRNELVAKYRYPKLVRVGAAGGIGTPEAAAAAFILGADFILTGSINQCTVEARTSETAKDMLQQMNVQDTEYVPAGDVFELGTRVQVLKKGVFFPARANKLLELYRQYNSLEEIKESTKTQIQEKYFKRSFDSVWEELKSVVSAQEIEKAERYPKNKMGLIFRWYFNYATQLALTGSEGSKVDYQIQCGPALGAFNQWVRGTDLENWRNRNVDKIGIKLMNETAERIGQQFQSLQYNSK